MSDMGGWAIQGTVLEACRCQDPEVLVTGPAGTGKTIADHVLTIARCEVFPGSRHLYVRQVRADMNDTILPSFERVLGPGHPALGDGCGPESRHRYTFPNGSIVVVAGLDRPQRTYSGEYDTVTVFEGTDTSEDAWQQFKRSLRHGKMGYTQLRMECNPDAPSHWIKRRADSGVMTAFYTSHRDNPAYWNEAAGDWTPAGREYVMGTLASLTGFRRSRLFLGEWVGAEGLIYDNFEPTRGGKPWHVQARTFEPVRRFVAVDDGTNDPFVSLCILTDDAGRAHISAMVYERGLTTDRKVRAVTNVKPDAAVVDNAALGLKLDINQAGINTPMAVKDILPGIAHVRNWFARTINGEPALTIDPSCGNLIDELQSYSWDSKALKEKPVGGNDHACDAMKYGLVHLSDPPSVIFDTASLNTLSARCIMDPYKVSNLVHEYTDGPDQDISLIRRESHKISLRHTDKGCIRFYCDLDLRIRPSQDNRYAMFCVPCDIGGKPTTLVAVGDVVSRSVVADAVFEGMHDKAARQCAMLGHVFFGDGHPALMGWWHVGAYGTAFQGAMRRVQYPRLWLSSAKKTEGWSPSPVEWNDAVGLLRVAWEQDQFHESDPNVFADAAGYGWHKGVIRPLMVAEDHHRWLTFGDRVIGRAGLWMMLRTLQALPPTRPAHVTDVLKNRRDKTETDLARL